MSQPWSPDREIHLAFARERITEQFPALAGLPIAAVGEGWDNAAFSVGGEWVFRFPRREIAVELLETELSVLPWLARRLPVAIPVPELSAQPTAQFDRPFAGYRWLHGTTACRCRLNDQDRLLLAEPLAHFLRALHDVDAAQAGRHGAPPDRLQRLDVLHRRDRLIERLEQLERGGLIERAAAWKRLALATSTSWTPGTETLVHGDLYCRHLLLEESRRTEASPQNSESESSGETRQLAGVIDWGDLHLGDPAVDLAIVHSFLPPSAHAAFLATYGAVDPERWESARFRALFSATAILAYGADIGDEHLVREGKRGLGYLLA